MADNKKLKKIDRQVNIEWKQLGVGFNPSRRQVWMRIDDELGFEFTIRMNKKQARSIAGRLLDAADDLESCRDREV